MPSGYQRPSDMIIGVDKFRIRPAATAQATTWLNGLET